MKQFWGKKRKRVTEQIFNLFDIYSSNFSDIYVTSYSIGALQAYLDYPNLIRNNKDLVREAREVCLDMDIGEPSNDNMPAAVSASAYAEGYQGIVRWFVINPENTIATAEMYKSRPLYYAFLFIKDLAQKLYQQDQEKNAHLLQGATLESVEYLGVKVICDAFCGKEYTNSDEEGGFILGSKAYCPTCAKESLPSIIEYGEERYIKARCPKGMSFKDFVLDYRGGNNIIKYYTKNGFQ